MVGHVPKTCFGMLTLLTSPFANDAAVTLTSSWTPNGKLFEEVINFVTANIIFFSNFHLSYWQYNFFDFPLLLLTVLNDCNGHKIWYKKTLLIILFLIQVSVNYTCRIHVGQVLQYKGLFHCYKATSSPFTMRSYSSKKL